GTPISRRAPAPASGARDVRTPGRDTMGGTRAPRARVEGSAEIGGFPRGDIDLARAASRRARRARRHEPRGCGRAVRLRENHRIPPREHLPEARRAVADGARLRVSYALAAPDTVVGLRHLLMPARRQTQMLALALA